jgi:hypothetical protein
MGLGEEVQHEHDAGFAEKDRNRQQRQQTGRRLVKGDVPPALRRLRRFAIGTMKALPRTLQP